MSHELMPADAVFEKGKQAALADIDRRDKAEWGPLKRSICSLLAPQADPRDSLQIANFSAEMGKMVWSYGQLVNLVIDPKNSCLQVNELPMARFSLMSPEDKDVVRAVRFSSWLNWLRFRQNRGLVPDQTRSLVMPDFKDNLKIGDRADMQLSVGNRYENLTHRIEVDGDGICRITESELLPLGVIMPDLIKAINQFTGARGSCAGERR